MDRLDYYYKQLLDHTDLDSGFDKVEKAEKDRNVDGSFFGIMAGLTPSLGAAPVVNITSGAAYDQLGRRVKAYSDGSNTKAINYGTTTAGASTAVAGGGNERWISIFAKYGRKRTDARTDGYGATVYYDQAEGLNSNDTNGGADAFYILVGNEAAVGAATRPALQSDAVLVCDISRRFGDAGNVLDTSRREDYIVVTGGSPYTIRRNKLLDALSDLVVNLNAHVGGSSGPHSAGTAAITMGNGPAWLGGRTNPALSNLQATLDRIITDLGAQTASDDGAERIGAQANGSLLAGSVRSQLDALDTTTPKLGANNTYSGVNSFNGAIGVNANGNYFGGTINYGAGALFVANNNDAQHLEKQIWDFQFNNLTNSSIIRVFTIKGSVNEESFIVITRNCYWDYNGGTQRWQSDTTGGSALAFTANGIKLCYNASDSHWGASAWPLRAAAGEWTNVLHVATTSPSLSTSESQLNWRTGSWTLPTTGTAGRNYVIGMRGYNYTATSTIHGRSETFYPQYAAAPSVSVNTGIDNTGMVGGTATIANITSEGFEWYNTASNVAQAFRYAGTVKFAY